MTMQQYCLRWNNHQPNFISVFSSLLNSESLVDVTLAAEGRHLQAHKVVLSACSSYFQSLFTINPCQHPIVILKDVKYTDLKVMVDFMYYGEVNVSQEQLPHILKTAEMLKIKGLAEMPVDQSVTRSHNNSADRAELFTQGDTSWSLDGSGRQLSPSPCPLSPSSKRKRLRKSSTGSGSGSTEKVVEEQQQQQQQQHTEVTLMTSASILSNVIKSESSYVADTAVVHHKLKQHSSDSEIHRGSSHESVDSEPPHQITLQVPQQQDLHISHTIEAQQSVEMAPSTSQPQQHSQQPITDKPISTTHAQLSQQYLQKTQLVMGTKRHRFLMRQPRIKRECESGQTGDSESGSGQYLSLPPIKMERQCSEPLPSHSPPPGNLLTVPGMLQKQHSHPLLPSQTHPPSPPLHLHLVHSQSIDHAERAISPIVVVSSDAPNSASLDYPSRGDSASTATIRVRSDELKRSASSPQSSTRSSHCPVVRSGPALGCNFCWNTVDTHGRILRRKTKYHCPECHTNLCIVPCFQEYHERHVSGTQTDPIALTTSVMKVFPKTSSM